PDGAGGSANYRWLCLWLSYYRSRAPAAGNSAERRRSKITMQLIAPAQPLILVRLFSATARLTTAGTARPNWSPQSAVTESELRWHSPNRSISRCLKNGTRTVNCRCSLNSPPLRRNEIATVLLPFFLMDRLKVSDTFKAPTAS